MWFAVFTKDAEAVQWLLPQYTQVTDKQFLKKNLEILQQMYVAAERLHKKEVAAVLEKVLGKASVEAANASDPCEYGVDLTL